MQDNRCRKVNVAFSVSLKYRINECLCSCTAAWHVSVEVDWGVFHSCFNFQTAERFVGIVISTLLRNFSEEEEEALKERHEKQGGAPGLEAS